MSKASKVGSRVRVYALSLVVCLAMLMSLTSPVHAQQDEYQVLVFSKVTNFYHDSIPAGIAAIEQLGAENGFGVDATDDAEVFNDEDLAAYDAIVFNNTNSTPQSGDLLDAQQRAAFQRFIRSGGGFVGLHAATASERDWSWYAGLVGAIFSNHPDYSGTPDGTHPGRIKVLDRVHPSTQSLPALWEREEEWYNFTTNPTGNVHTLAQIKLRDGIDGLQMGVDHPYSWCHEYDGGRSWYTAGGHAPSSFDEPLFVDHLLGGIEWAAGAAEGDCGATVNSAFEWTQLATEPDLGDAFEIDVAPDGTVFYIRRTGQFHTIDPDTGEINLIGDLGLGFNPSDPNEGLPVDRHSDGLTGFALSPDFDENGWLYALYADPDEYLYYLSRFTYDFDEQVLDLDSEQQMLDFATWRYTPGLANVHMGGSVEFGPDGSLYFSFGDNTDFSQSSNRTPIDERPGREWNDAQATSGNTNDLRGKINRIMPTDDGGYEIPEGNLFPPDTSDPELTRPEIYAMGFRNPFRITVDQDSGALLVGDYGPDANSPDPNRGPEGLVEWSKITEAGNYGWPYCVGDNIPYVDYDFATGQSGDPFDCDNLINDSPNNTGLQEIPPAQEAFIWYGYGLSPEFPELGTGGAGPMSGPVYHYDPDLDSDTKFPEYYDGKWFVYEYTRNWFKVLSLVDEDLEFEHESFDPVQAGDLLSINPFPSGVSYRAPFDALFGPDGSLYVLDFGSGNGVGRGSTNTGAGIYRVDYLGDDGAPAEPGTPLCPDADASDDFEGDGLDLDRWSQIVRHNPSGYTVEGGQLILPTAHGDMFGQVNNAPNLILQPGADGPWQITTQVTLDAQTGFQQAGVMAYAADHTFAKAFLMGRPGSDLRRLSFVVQTDGVARNTGEDWIEIPADFPTTVQLRIASDGSQLTSAYSTDGEAWTPLGRPAPLGPLAGADLGVFATAGGGGDTTIPVIDAAFDFFDLSVPSSSPNDDFDGDTLDLCRWSRTLNHDPSGYTLADGQLTLPTAHGDLAGNYFHVPNTILQPAPEGAWQAETQVTLDPTTGFQQAGLVLVGDENNFAKAVLMGRPGSDPRRVSFFSVTGGQERNQAADWVNYPENDGPTTLTIRIISDGSQATAAYSLDGEQWVDVGRDYDLSAASSWDIGIFATAGGAGNTSIPVIDAAFDWFTLEGDDDHEPPPDLPLCPDLAASDDFEGDELDLDRWSEIVRHDPDGYTVEGGQLILPTVHGDMFNQDTDAPNLILQPGRQGPWEITTQVTLDAQTGFQQAGPMAYAADHTFAKAFLMGRPGSDLRRLSFVVQTNGVPRNTTDDWIEIPADFPTTVQLRIASDGAQLTSAYSTDGEEWTPLGRPAPLGALAGADLGVFATSGGGGDPTIPVIDAAFDFFELVAVASPNDDFEGDELDLCRWSATLDHDPDGYTLADGQLILPTAHGDLSEQYFNTPNVIMQPAPGGIWQAETQVTLDPQTGFQQAGLVLVGDENNFAKAVLMGRPGSDPRRVSFFSVTGGQARNQAADWVVYPENDGPTTLTIRLTSNGSSVVAAYSLDGEQWVDVGRSYSLAAASSWDVGIVATAGGAGSTTIPVIDAAFDWFTLEGEGDHEPEPNDPPEPPDGFEALFDHNTLDGWEKLGGGDFRVTSDGTLQTCCGGGGLLWYTPQAFGDFNLHFEYKMSSATDNSGMFLRFPAPLNWSGGWNAQPDDTVRGYEAQIEDNPSGGDPQKTGSIYNNAPVTEVLANPIGEWNTYEIEVVGDTYTVWLNGELINEFTGDGSRALEGHIGIQAHHAGSEVEFRNIWIRELDDVGEPGIVEASLDPADPDGDNDWYVSPVSLTLASDDDGAELVWRHAGDDEWTAWTAPVVFDDDGQYTIQYLGADDDGEPGEGAVFDVDVGPDFAFYPDQLTVTQGDTVVFTLAGGFHNVVIEDLAGNEIDRSGPPDDDWEPYEFTADTPGTFIFHCEPHPGMEGVLTVESSSGGGGEPAVGELSFNLDQTPPETSAAVDGDTDGDAYLGEVSVTLDAQDATSGVAQTVYRIDGGDQQSYDGAFTIEGPGTHTLEFRSVDVAGNVEDWQELVIEIVEDDPPVELELELTASTRCVAGNVYVTVTARNDNDVPVDIELASDLGSRTFAGVAPGRFASHAYNTRSSSVDAGTATVRASAVVDGIEVEVEQTVDFDAASCG